MAYDRGITVFSPDGRLFQVEYAREAVKKGTTTIGLKFKGGVILIVDKRVSSRLVEPDSIEKIYNIDEYIGCATSGLVADARILVDQARKDAQTHKMTYNENIAVEMLVKKICDFKQNYTQYGGVRPFGTALLMAGTDDQSELAKEYFDDMMSMYFSPKMMQDIIEKGLEYLSGDWDYEVGSGEYQPTWIVDAGNVNDFEGFQGH